MVGPCLWRTGKGAAVTGVWDRDSWGLLNLLVCSCYETSERREEILYFLLLHVCKGFFLQVRTADALVVIFPSGVSSASPGWILLINLKKNKSVYCYILSVQNWEEVIEHWTMKQWTGGSQGARCETSSTTASETTKGRDKRKSRENEVGSGCGQLKNPIQVQWPHSLG